MKEYTMAEAPKTLDERVLEAIREGMAMGIKMSQPAAYVGPAPVDQSTCSKCKQAVRGCHGDHALMVVFPGNPRHGKAFRGCILNGVTYLSTNGLHKIVVPAKNDFAYQIQEFEHNEDEMLNGRVVEHGSGSIGTHGTGFQAAQQAWR
jgi:hypothetical protein